MWIMIRLRVRNHQTSNKQLAVQLGCKFAESFGVGNWFHSVGRLGHHTVFFCETCRGGWLNSSPDLPVAYIFGTKLPGKPLFQETRLDPWFHIYRELENEGKKHVHFPNMDMDPIIKSNSSATIWYGPLPASYKFINGRKYPNKQGFFLHPSRQSHLFQSHF